MWQFLFSFFLDQVFPQSCCICKKTKQELCSDCLKKIRPDPKWETLQGIDLWSGVEYHQSIHAQLIRGFKYQGGKTLINSFVNELSFSGLPMVDVIIPIPLHRKKFCERGYNQSLLIAKCLQKHCYKQIPIEQKLIRTKYTKSQATLDKSQRLKNVQNCFVWKGGSLEGKVVLLVDDVISTGSTMKACADRLHDQGVENVLGFGLARGGK